MTTRDRVAEAFERLAGNVSAIAREVGVSRTTVRYHIKLLCIGEKPLAAGRVNPLESQKRPLPPKGCVKYYVLTSAQNNTHVFERAWTSLRALGKHYNAEMMVGTYSYNVNAYGRLSTKRGHAPSGQSDLWFAECLLPYIEATDDRNIILAPGLLWCGRSNISPTADRPLSGFETYTGRLSGIFPHAKFAVDSVASGKFEATKFNFTTGTITQQNYIQKKAGLKAEHHHAYGALLVEVDHNGRWFARQLNADGDGVIYDLDLKADGDKVTSGHRVEAITWGDIHHAQIDPEVEHLAWGPDGMLDTLRPRYQFMHDLIDFQSRRHWDSKNPHKRYEMFVRGTDSVETEMQGAADFLSTASRLWCRTVVVDSNHDNDFERWLRETDYRYDPPNAEYFLETQLKKYQSIRLATDFHAVEWALRRAGCPKPVRFLREDEPYIICPDAHGGIECGMHGHIGVHGTRGSPLSFSKIGRKANTAHTHSCGILHGIYVAGHSGVIDQGYNRGPSAWSHTHTVTYANGKRALVTMWDGRWRA